ncbi:hypothetical protein Taro_005207 [Colocasia esculenta]|uniref:Uncharacterized protein n=1 Tax=Colocasia esculenta TaxID=4460 RepID=A0A843TTX8_COLES|nr:hypothetical protein [Colocasia esculenta]
MDVDDRVYVPPSDVYTIVNMPQRVPFYDTGGLKHMCLDVRRFMTPEGLSTCLDVRRFMTPEDLSTCALGVL